MTEISIQAPALPGLDPATRGTLLQNVADTIPHLPSTTEAEQTARLKAAFTLLAWLAPTDPVQAMLAAETIAAHHAAIDAYRWAARPDLLPALHQRYQAKAASLSRLSSAKRRELLRWQANHPAVPESASTASEVQARAAARASQAAAQATARPAAQPQAAAPGSRAADPARAMFKQLIAMAAATPEPEDDDDAPTEAEITKILANAHAQLAEFDAAPATAPGDTAAPKAPATKLAA